MSVERVELEEISYLSDAVTLELAWDDLWERCPDATVFQSPQWLLGVWRHLEARTGHLLVTARLDGRLMGVLPLWSSRPDCTELQGACVSDYLNILVAPSASQRVVPVWLDYLRDMGLAQSLQFAQLPRDSPLLVAEPPVDWMISISEQDVCPYVPLPARSTKLQTVLPISFYKRLEQARRTARRDFRIDVTEAAATEASTYLERLFKLHTDRWNARKEPGVFVESSVRQFHSDVVPQLIARGRLWLLELRFDDVTVASLMALRGHGRALYYIGGYAPDYARFSPGRLLIASLFERALSEGYAEVDFLRGVEPYKYDWGARNRSTYRLTLEPLEGQVCMAV